VKTWNLIYICVNTWIVIWNI